MLETRMGKGTFTNIDNIGLTKINDISYCQF